MSNKCHIYTDSVVLQDPTFSVYFIILGYYFYYTTAFPTLSLLFRKVYLYKGQSWQFDPGWYPVGSYGSALYVPPKKYAACSFVHSSYICVVSQLQVKTFEEENINIHHCTECIVASVQPAAVL